MTEQQFKRKYNSVSSLPTHLFRSRDLTKPVGQEFREYLLFLVNTNPEALRYLHRKSLEFSDYGGANKLGWHRWLAQLTSQLNKGNNKYDNEDTEAAD